MQANASIFEWDRTADHRGEPPRIPAGGSPGASGPARVLVFSGDAENFVGNDVMDVRLDVLKRFQYLRSGSPMGEEPRPLCERCGREIDPDELVPAVEVILDALSGRVSRSSKANRVDFHETCFDASDLRYRRKPDAG